MTNGKVFQFRAGKAYQCRASVDRAPRLCREGGSSTGSPVRYVQAPGLSLYTGSRVDGQRGSDSGEKDRFYGQALTEPNPGNSATCEIHWAKLKRHSHTGSGSISLQGSGAWLRRRSPLRRLSWNMALTGFQPPRLPKSTNFWFLRGSGRGPIEADV